MTYCTLGRRGFDSLPPFVPLTLLVLGRIAQYVQPSPGLRQQSGSWRYGLCIFVAERTLVPAPSNFRLRASAANVTAPHPDGWNPLLSPSRARNILQIHRETRKQPHECPERGNVARRSGLYKMTSWAPRGALIIAFRNGKSLSRLRQGSNMVPSGFHP